MFISFIHSFIGLYPPFFSLKELYPRLLSWLQSVLGQILLPYSSETDISRLPSEPITHQPFGKGQWFCWVQRYLQIWSIDSLQLRKEAGCFLFLFLEHNCWENDLWSHSLWELLACAIILFCCWNCWFLQILVIFPHPVASSDFGLFQCHMSGDLFATISVLYCLIYIFHLPCFSNSSGLKVFHSHFGVGNNNTPQDLQCSFEYFGLLFKM